MRRYVVLFAFLFLLHPLTGVSSFATASESNTPGAASTAKKERVLTIFKQVGALDTLPSASMLQNLLLATWLPPEMTDEKAYVPKQADSLWSSITRNSCGVVVLAVNPSISINETDVRNRFAGRTWDEVQKAEGGMGSAPVTKTMFAALAHCDAHFEFNAEGDKVRSVLLCWRRPNPKKDS